MVQGGRPKPLNGTTVQQPVLGVPGEVFALRKLLPATVDYDFNIHIMDFKPGQTLYVKVRQLRSTDAHWSPRNRLFCILSLLEFSPAQGMCLALHLELSMLEPYCIPIYTPNV